jgi:transcriptional/translational regulatory protein YebC/TACO1
MVDLDEKKKKECLELFEALDELDSVQEIFSNLKI